MSSCCPQDPRYGADKAVETPQGTLGPTSRSCSQAQGVELGKWIASSPLSPALLDANLNIVSNIMSDETGVDSRLEAQQEGSPPKRQRATRGKGLRTRSGCHNCRARRVKCNEAKPRCAACDRRGQKCIYQNQPPKPIRRRDRTSEGIAQSDDRDEDGSPPQPKTISDEPNQRVTRSNQQYEVSQTPTSALQTEVDAHGVDEAHLTTQHECPSSLNINLELDQTTQTSIEDPGINLGVTPEELQLWAASPESSWSNPPLYSAETASLLWLGLLANDASAVNTNAAGSALDLTDQSCMPSSERATAVVQGWVQGVGGSTESLNDDICVSREDKTPLEPNEVMLFRHFVQDLSAWIDITDPEHSFAVLVANMALRDLGLMRAILALSARHLSVCSPFSPLAYHIPDAETLGVKYYHQTLQYLQRAMQHAPYLRSDELLATVLVISTYEMLDTHGRDWERHLKGVFWIQRSQLMHGESEGLKQAIWWAWLRQDIWAAFKDRRKILSFYILKRPCSELGFWELVNRSVFLLGQCVNYASAKEIQAGEADVQARISRGQELWSSLEEWMTCFSLHDCRLPTVPDEDFPFEPIWINPSAASLAVQVHHFARLLLSDLMPAIGGLAELNRRNANVQSSAAVICGIAYCTTDSAPMITSTQCLYAARPHLTSQREIEAVNGLLHSHQKQTGWPNGDVRADVQTADLPATSSPQISKL